MTSSTSTQEATTVTDDSPTTSRHLPQSGSPQLETTQVYRVYIKTTPQAVWDAITSPEWSAKYGYGGTVDYDLKPGGAFTAYTSEEMRAMGAGDVAIDGEVLESDPPHKLVTTWRMVMDDGLKDEGFTRITYEIQPSTEGVTKVTIIHELEGAPQLQLLLSGQWETQGAGGGWAWVLSDLKSLLETGHSMFR
jgi:uncharacterized protein YndB with AHSA1/START domain